MVSLDSEAQKTERLYGQHKCIVRSLFCGLFITIGIQVNSMLFQDKDNLIESKDDNVINLSLQVTDSEVEQLLAANQEIQDSCPGGVCQLNWRPARRPKAA